MDPAIAAIIVALIAGIPASVAAILAVLMRRDAAAPSRRVDEIRYELSSPDANGNTLRQEVQEIEAKARRIERTLDEHVRQAEQDILATGRSRREISDWLRKMMETTRHDPEGDKT